MRSLFFILYALAKQVISTASGYDSWTCLPSQHNTPFTQSVATSPFFALRLLAANGSVTVGFQPGFPQTVELYSIVSTSKMAGVIAAPFAGALTACPTSCSSVSGSFAAPAGISYIRPMTNCVGGITQTSKQSSTSFNFSWTPSNASASASSITIWAIVVGPSNTYEAISVQVPVIGTSISLSPTATPKSIIIETSITSTPTSRPTYFNISSLTMSPRRNHTPTSSPTIVSMTLQVSNSPTPSITTIKLSSASTSASASSIVDSNRFINDAFTVQSSGRYSSLNIAAISITAIIVVVLFSCLCYYGVKRKYKKYYKKSVDSRITVMHPAIYSHEMPVNGMV